MKVNELLNNETVRNDGENKLLLIDEKWVIELILKDAMKYNGKCMATFINESTIKATKHENDELYIILNEVF